MLLLLLLPHKPKLISREYNKSEIDAALMGKSLHIVFVADSGPSMCMSHIPFAEGLTYESAASLANTVNVENETGTLHPVLSITLVPLSVFRTRDDKGNRELMRTHIKDVFKANEEYIMLPEIFFCLESRPDFDLDLAKEIINEMTQEEYIFTQRVSVL